MRLLRRTMFLRISRCLDLERYHDYCPADLQANAGPDAPLDYGICKSRYSLDLPRLQDKQVSLEVHGVPALVRA